MGEREARRKAEARRPRDGCRSATVLPAFTAALKTRNDNQRDGDG